LAALVAAALPLAAIASSHREAPFITEHPKVDGTDFYMFRSYEPTREGFVTLIANYLPLQAAYGGPNYFTLDPDAVYDIHIDNDGDALEDLTFRFRFKNDVQNLSLEVGPEGNQRTVPVPLINTVSGGIGPGQLDRNGLNVIETYTVELIRGDKRNQGQLLVNAAGGMDPTVFTKPVDNIGSKSITEYSAYSAQSRVLGNDSRLPARQAVRQATQGIVLRQPRRDFRSRKHERRRPAGRRAQQHRRRERDVVDANRKY